MALINHQDAAPIFTSSRKFFAGLSPEECCLMNVLILRSEYMMFWALVLRNFLTPIKEIEEKMLSQRSRSVGWLSS